MSSELNAIFSGIRFMYLFVYSMKTFVHYLKAIKME